MQTITLKVDGGRDISFVGDLVAQEVEPSTAINTKIYETEKGNWLVAEISGRDKLIRHKVIENQSHDELVTLLGFSNTAKSIYNQLHIDTAQNLDI